MSLARQTAPAIAAEAIPGKCLGLLRLQEVIFHFPLELFGVVFPLEFLGCIQITPYIVCA